MKLKKYSSYTILTILVYLVCSCTFFSTKIENRIGWWVRWNCANQVACILRLRELTNFDWDKVYAFPLGTTQEDVERIIGGKIPEFQEFSRTLVFIRDNQIIYVEQNPGDVEGIVDGEVGFVSSPSIFYGMYDKNSSFEVKIISMNQKTYYELVEVKE